MLGPERLLPVYQEVLSFQPHLHKMMPFDYVSMCNSVTREVKGQTDDKHC